jgi:hypothetical protein
MAAAGITVDSIQEIEGAIVAAAAVWADEQPFGTAAAPKLDTLLRCLRVCFRGCCAAVNNTTASGMSSAGMPLHACNSSAMFGSRNGSGSSAAAAAAAAAQFYRVHIAHKVRVFVHMYKTAHRSNTVGARALSFACVDCVLHRVDLCCVYSHIAHMLIKRHVLCMSNHLRLIFGMNTVLCNRRRL